jgi:hypothetical protein
MRGALRARYAAGMRAPRTAAACFIALCVPVAHAGSLRFLGTPSTSADRVEIRLDAPARPVDVGGDFTIEFFVRMAPGSNPVAQPCTAANDRWIFGNILLDRDVFGAGDAGDWGVSLMQGRIAFGASVGSVGATACGATDLRDGDWHHVALTRSASSGQLRVFVDGQADGQASGATGDMSYRDGRTTQWSQSDPFLVLGNEKHFGPEAFAGWMDELRISRVIRHAAAFIPPAAPFTADADTMALYSFDEGTGASLGDRSGAPGGPSNGVLRVGGDPAGPLWSSETPFAAVLFGDSFEPPAQR